MAGVIGKAMDTIRYDAIVIGSGISGGWAAKELCEKGLRTLLLDRGRHVEHVQDYPTAMSNSWDMPNRGFNTPLYRQSNPVQSLFSNETDRQFFVADDEHPYIQETPFNWVRGYQTGGRSLVWGRQCYRWSDLDFAANEKEGVAVDWPIRYRDLERWYDYVERFIGVSGKAEHLPQLPDGQYLPAMELNCIEEHMASTLKKRYDDRILTIARVANLTRGWKHRGPCMYRNQCSRGCPFGGYFSSNSATIPSALATGNLTLRPFSVVTEIIYDDSLKKATGVRITDTVDKKQYEYFARVIFVNASTIATTAILLNSKSARFPDGLGNDSGQLGHNLMDHHSSSGAYGTHEGFQDRYYKGRRPCGFLIPRFQNLGKGSAEKFLRGYNFQGEGKRLGWEDQASSLRGFGKTFKQQLLTPGPWSVWMAGWGECLPYFNNTVKLSIVHKDQWDVPTVSINFSFKENEQMMKKHIQTTAVEMLENAGFKHIEPFDYQHPGGTTVHEMGTARMGRDPKTSVLNDVNQVHAVKNVFVTDGSCMTSSGCQNPSLTYMALTARACHFAVTSMKKNEL